jgi:hypothetical protein
MRTFRRASALLITIGLFFTAIACAPPPPEDPNAPAKPDCKLNSDGTRTCGYHCMLGSDGRWGCAQTANGVCSLEATGGIVCSQ